MQKNVASIQEYFPPQTSGIVGDLEALRWPRKPLDLTARFATLLSEVDFDSYSRDRPLRLLDVGCGLGLLLDYLKLNQLLDKVEYTGVDLLDWALQEVRGRWPDQRFDKRDVRDEPYMKDEFDYCIICGIFTVRMGNSYEEEVALAQSTLKALWPSVSVGLSFNSMSKHVDWERDDLFHWPLDDIMAFCKRALSRHVTFRLDYGLWEVSTLVRKTPRPPLGKTPPTW
jgi:hypothetical protein